MEKEELKSKITTELGSTQLSEKTISDYIDDVFEDVKDAESVSDDYIARKVRYLKSVNGQLHADVAVQVDDYKKKNPYQKPKQDVKPDNNEPEWFKAYREEQERRISSMEESRKAEIEKNERNEILESVKTGLKAKFREANMDINGYFLNQAMNEVEVGNTKDENGNSVKVDVDELIKKAESNYYKHLKAAGIEKPTPRRGGVGGGGKDTWLDEQFAKKGKKEGWKK